MYPGEFGSSDNVTGTIVGVGVLVGVGGIGVLVGGIGVAVGGIGVAVGGIGVAVGGTGVAVGVLVGVGVLVYVGVGHAGTLKDDTALCVNPFQVRT